MGEKETGNDFPNRCRFFFEKRENPMTEFEESAFESIVEKIIVINQHELEFHLIGGLKFKENI